jgi:hypothetical protein
MTKRLVPIAERALYQRINRKLRGDGEVLKRSRGRVETTLGDYYVVNVERNFVAQHHVDLVELARELGVMAEWEFLQ